ncbi:MAG: DUF1640 domain-containing protein [Alphaproteobacteria bacterium]|nr:DUF1640 domain-containing protein [Alphaproteobacteria bacterium]
MTAAAFDTLAAAEALQQAGIGPTQAKAIVEVAGNAAGVGRDSLATKADLAALRAEFKADMATLESRLTWRMAVVMAALLAVHGAAIIALLQPAVS